MCHLSLSWGLWELSMMIFSFKGDRGVSGLCMLLHGLRLSLLSLNHFILKPMSGVWLYFEMSVTFTASEVSLNLETFFLLMSWKLLLSNICGHRVTVTLSLPFVFGIFPLPGLFFLWLLFYKYKSVMSDLESVWKCTIGFINSTYSQCSRKKNKFD